MQKIVDSQKRELLFHYTKFDTALFHILPEKQLLLNPLAFMNDIYETRSRLGNFWPNWENEKRGLSNFEYLKENKVKIISFVKDRKIRGFDNQLMWSFYGEKYQGVCLIFDKQKLIQNFEYTFGESGKKGEIIYELKNPIPLNHDELIDIEGVMLSNADLRVFTFDKNSSEIWKLFLKGKRYIDLFFRKNKQWDVETEYRFLAFDQKKPNIMTLRTDNLYFDFKDSLIGVMLGPMFNSEYFSRKIDYLKKLAGESNFMVYLSKYIDNKIIPLRTFGTAGNKEIDYNEAFFNEEYL